MLIQRQYTLWKLANKILWVWVLWLLLLTLFFNWRISSIKEEINQNNSQILKLNNKVQDIKNSPSYKKFQLANVIQKKENQTNYVVLYTLLKEIKDDLLKTVKSWTYNFDKFSLKISKDNIHISLVVPNFDSLYSSNSMDLFGKLDRKDFIKEIFVRNYKVKDNFVYFDMDIKTK